jgi:hypothetical protein
VGSKQKGSNYGFFCLVIFWKKNGSKYKSVAIYVDARYNYTSMQTKVYILYSDVYTYTNSYRI